MVRCIRVSTMALILLVVALLMAAMNINIASSSPDQQRASKKLALKVRPRVVINVLVNRRLESLKRLCESLLAADYMGDTNVALEFHLEAGQPASIRSYVVNFEWPLGPKVVHSRLVRAGLIAIAVESWYPTDDNEYGVLLEDDIEVSPHFYRWIQTALAAYTRAGSPANVLGVSLYGLHVVAATSDHRSELKSRGDEHVWTGRRLPCDWDGLYFPRAWRQFATHMRTKVDNEGVQSEALPRTGSSIDLEMYARGSTNRIMDVLLQRISSSESIHMICPRYGASAQQWGPVGAFEMNMRQAKSASRARTWNPRLRHNQGIEQGQKGDKTKPSPNRVVINVLVNRRLESLKRLCESLLAADYMGDTNVALEFHLEAGQPASIRSYVVNFEWPLGPKVVHSRLVRAGLIAVVVESWYPTDDNEYGVLLEDDIEVSPHFYRWIQTALAAYTRAGSPANVLGVSLYTPRVVETAQGEQRRPISHRPFDPQGLIFNITGERNSPFLQQLPCSWGAVYFPRTWREFVHFMDFRTAGGNLSSTEARAGRFTIPRSTTTGWKASWKKFMIELAWARGYFMLYPNFPDQASLSTNHMEVGEHIARNDPHHHKDHFTVPLIHSSDTLDTMLDGQRLSWDNIPALNLFGDPYRPSTAPPLVAYRAPEPFASKDGLDTRPWRSAGEDLIVTTDKPWAGKLTSEVSDSYLGTAYHMCVQEDGNIVVYQVDISGDILAPEWESYSGSAGTIGKELRLSLQPDGNLVLLKTKTNPASLSRRAYNTTHIIWQSGYHGKSRPHFVYLHSNGVLLVYEGTSPCEHGAPVWASGHNYSDVEPCAQRRPKLAKTYASLACKEYVPSIHAYLQRRDNDRFTIILSCTSGEAINRLLTHYAKMPIVEKILVVFPKSIQFSSEDLKLGGTLVHFLPQEVYSPNSKLKPSMLIGTPAVLVLDDEVVVDQSNMVLLFDAWRHNPQSIAGFSPVSVRNIQGRWYFEPSSHPERRHAIAMKVAMIHTSVLQEYTCGVGSRARDIVERYSWGESLGIALTGALMKFTPLYVRPDTMIDMSSVKPIQSSLTVRGSFGEANACMTELFALSRELLPRAPEFWFG